MGLIQRISSVEIKDNDVCETHPDVVKGLGCTPGKHHIQLKPRAKPAVHLPRKAPVQMRDKIHKGSCNYYDMKHHWQKLLLVTMDLNLTATN